MSIVERIKEKCLENGTTINTIEKKCNLGHGTIRRWSENSPAVDKVIIVANYLQVSLEWLLIGKEASELSQDEKKLVDLYRATDSRGKNAIMRTAEAEAESVKQSAETSSTLRIG
ncbi:MAG: helix-turn-helix domain-containing protein [Lachnospiraceae bacterium]|nr:helix-turn-helix domain-containing protein [Lachnospiraceae bacterium]